jgi:hypothetical protein
MQRMPLLAPRPRGNVRPAARYQYHTQPPPDLDAPGLEIHFPHQPLELVRLHAPAAGRVQAAAKDLAPLRSRHCYHYEKHIGKNNENIKLLKSISSNPQIIY